MTETAGVEESTRRGVGRFNLYHPDFLLLVVDLMGVSVFAVEGAMAAIRANLDILGLLVISFATALGGGSRCEPRRKYLNACRPPGAWDRRFASDLGPAGPGSVLAVVDDFCPVWWWSSGWLVRQWRGTTAGSVVGHLLGRALWWLPRVLRGLQGSARGAERSEPLWSPEVLGRAGLPGREDGPGFELPSLREGRGCGGSAPAVGGGLGVMAGDRAAGWLVFAGAGRTRRR